ncbi:MAG: hypothetical protein R3B74_15500 [Nitrospirales bacterium]|nr:hypothetical protein [Nitrospirales bacterium]
MLQNGADISMATDDACDKDSNSNSTNGQNQCTAHRSKPMALKKGEAEKFGITRGAGRSDLKSLLFKQSAGDTSWNFEDEEI